MFYLLHGDDEFTCREQLKKLRGAGDFAYNQDYYFGGEVNLATLTATCSTLPFLSEQRLVILEGLPKKRRGEDSAPAGEPAAKEGEEKGGKTGKAAKKKKSKSSTEGRAAFEKGLAEYTPQLPESTVLIVLVDEKLPEANALLKAAQAHGTVIQSTLPKSTALEGWIKKRAQAIGVKITPEAVSLLANFIGSHLRLLANELDKLATYVGKDKTIDADAVRKLSPQVQAAKIFDLTDALAQRNRKMALDLLHELIADGQPPLLLIGTITSQLRNLLLVKELAENGLRAGQIAAAIGIAPFVAEKAYRNINKFSSAQLEDTYRRLLETDAALKRSRLTPDMALDLLVVQFGG